VSRTPSSTTTLIGLDCATQPKKVGLARGSFDGGRLTVHEIRPCSKHETLVDTLASWIREPALLAIDAPLGWPQPLGHALSQHRAGVPLDIPAAEDAFSRLTDRVVWKRSGYRPLDVGADRIARTAQAALRLIQEVRSRGPWDIPLAWAPGDAKVAMIEVYPAATLQARNLVPRGYKGFEHEHAHRRAELLEGVRSELTLEVTDEALLLTDHALDAVLCLLAGADFLRGEVVSPMAAELERARREGWIWFRPRASRGPLRTRGLPQARQLGHADIHTTMRYTHHAPELTPSIFDRLAEGDSAPSAAQVSRASMRRARRTCGTPRASALAKRDPLLLSRSDPPEINDPLAGLRRPSLPRPETPEAPPDCSDGASLVAAASRYHAATSGSGVRSD
jgi:predicted nuclease with RNAse H fold